MKVVVGLGNVGVKYANTRHNVGFIAVDKLSSKLKNSVFLKPSNMMNSSGLAVKKLVSNEKIDPSDLYIIHDDLDIGLGKYKIQKRGPKDHKGVNSVEEALGTSNFWRVRIGVDNRNSNDRATGEEYVLGDFTSKEKETLDKVLDEICKKLATL
jgi:PTH1 family peptidyl-tRNA hydrolase